MEFWIILTKLALVVYLAINSVLSNVTNISWFVLSLLLYLCVNISIYIVKRDIVSKLTILVSIILSIISNYLIHPLFLLLLPLSIIELATYYIHQKWKVFTLAMLPVLYMEGILQPFYGLVTVFSYMIFTMSNSYSGRLRMNERQIDKMRKDLQRITKNLDENNEYIKQSEYTFKLEERNRLSQEIHDKIGHSMTGALFQTEAAKRLIITDERKATELLQNAINILKEGIDQIRFTLKNIKPPTEQIGIHQLKLFIDTFSRKHDIKTFLVYEGNLDFISPIQWKIIHGNITEALTNTMKYADASFVSIDIHVLNKIIKVEVKDNGKGTLKIKKGIGIIGMEERTASINGKIIIDGSNGFSVTTLLPIQ